MDPSSTAVPTIDFSAYIPDLATLRLGLRVLTVLAVYLLLNYLGQRLLRIHGLRAGYDRDRVRAMGHRITVILRGIALLAVVVALGIEVGELQLVLTSVLTLVGVALFATWSVLSNVTAGVMLYFTQDLHIGDQVRIIDGPNVIDGTIILFGVIHMQLRQADGSKIYYPNNVIIQRPIQRLPSAHDSTMLSLRRADRSTIS
jgi:small-conductance mechanosensitive channel